MALILSPRNITTSFAYRSADVKSYMLSRPDIFGVIFAIVKTGVTWHSGRVEPAALTPQELYARLRAQHPGLSEEKLARELDIGLKTLQRLNQGHGTAFDTTVRLLDEVGWLSLDDSAPTRAELRRVKRRLQDLIAAVELLP